MKSISINLNRLKKIDSSINLELINNSNFYGKDMIFCNKENSEIKVTLMYRDELNMRRQKTHYLKRKF